MRSSSLSPAGRGGLEQDHRMSIQPGSSTAGPAPQRILLVTGLSGAGKSTALRTLEDLGWEVVDNLPLSLLEDLLETPLGKGSSRRRRPLALGVDSRTRDFDANRIVKQIKALASEQRVPVE